MRCQKSAYRSTRRFASSRLKRRSASRTRFTASTRFDAPDVADLTDSGVQSAEAAVDVADADLERPSIRLAATIEAAARAPTENIHHSRLTAAPTVNTSMHTAAVANAAVVNVERCRCMRVSVVGGVQAIRRVAWRRIGEPSLRSSRIRSAQNSKDRGTVASLLPNPLCPKQQGAPAIVPQAGAPCCGGG